MASRHQQASRPTRRSRPAPSRAPSDFETVIRERVIARLGRRVRNLRVVVSKGVIRLTGECSTYYSKQLAQHAVLGVVEDETIKNDIDVAVPTPTGNMGLST
ncbi:MAG: BON domain-containing protein [Planctomycetota bacterium]